MSTTAPESDLEEEIRAELERLEQIFNEESQLESVSLKPNRVSYSAYEYAEAEGEKEELEDKLNQLLSKADDWKSQIEYVSRLNAGLQAENLRLVKENASLRQGGSSTNGTEIIPPTASAAYKVDTDVEADHVYECFGSLSQGSIALELLLAEARARTANAEAALRDAEMVKDAALQELEKERLLRIHVGRYTTVRAHAHLSLPWVYFVYYSPVAHGGSLSPSPCRAEKERDAYSAAYEASLQHFDKWSRAARSKS